MAEANPFAQFVTGAPPEARGANPFAQFVQKEAPASASSGSLADQAIAPPGPEFNLSKILGQPSFMEQAEALHKQSNPNSLRPTEGEIDLASGMVGPAAVSEVKPAQALFQLARRGAAPVAPGEVTLTKAMETGDPELFRQENAARRGLLGEGAKAQAEASDAERAQQVAALKESNAQSLDPAGQNRADTPLEAAATAQGGVQKAAQTAKAGVQAGYDKAKQAGGQIEAGALQGIGGRVRATLSSGPNQVFVDDQLTPWASRALTEVDKLGDLNIQNRAAAPHPIDPVTGKPELITEVNLEGVDQVRKRLVDLRNGAYANNRSDGRAASAVLNAFDNHIADAYTGPPEAMQAFKDARAASARFKQTFTALNDDPVGRKIEAIIGTRGRDPLTYNDVADALWGVSGTDPGTTNVGVANRVKNILGEQSPEWAAVKQGLWRKLTEPAGEPGTIGKRLLKFLDKDGSDMANAVYSPQERLMMRQYAELHNKMQSPVGTINRSDTSTFVGPMLKKIDSNMTSYIGFALAHSLGLGPIGEVISGLVSGGVKQFVTNGMNARKISAQMPLATEAVEKFEKAVAAHAKANTPPSRVALSTATTNLVRAFKPLGITFEGTLPTTGSVPAAADEKNK